MFDGALHMPIISRFECGSFASFVRSFVRSHDRTLAFYYADKHK